MLQSQHIIISYIRKLIFFVCTPYASIMKFYIAYIFPYVIKVQAISLHAQ